MDPLSDEELVSRYRAQAGSVAADSLWTELFDRHHRRVALWCLRLTGDREAAADLAQEIFIKAFKNLDSFRGESKFSTWLYSIARNHCFNEVKARAARPEQAGELALAGLIDGSPNPQSQLERETSAAVVRELLEEGSLSEVESQVMTLHYGEDLPLEAVSRLLNLDNASGAKAYIVSAKRKLARAVERWKARDQRVRR
jgi:RNA polymerase sigma-70 factor, ECF subfamily